MWRRKSGSARLRGLQQAELTSPGPKFASSNSVELTSNYIIAHSALHLNHKCHSRPPLVISFYVLAVSSSSPTIATIAPSLSQRLQLPTLPRHLQIHLQVHQELHETQKRGCHDLTQTSIPTAALFTLDSTPSTRSLGIFDIQTSCLGRYSWRLGAHSTGWGRAYTLWTRLCRRLGAMECFGPFLGCC